MRIIWYTLILMSLGYNSYSQTTTKVNFLDSNISDYKLYAFVRGEFYKINTPAIDSLPFLQPGDTLFSLILIAKGHFYSFGIVRSRDILSKDLVALNFEINHLNSCCFTSFLYKGITGIVYSGTRNEETECNKLDIIIYPRQGNAIK